MLTCDLGPAASAMQKTSTPEFSETCISLARVCGALGRAADPGCVCADEAFFMQRADGTILVR